MKIYKNSYYICINVKIDGLNVHLFLLYISIFWSILILMHKKLKYSIILVYLIKLIFFYLNSISFIISYLIPLNIFLSLFF